MVIFHKKWRMYNEIKLTKNKMDLNNRKMTNHSPSPITNTYTEATRVTASEQDTNFIQKKQGSSGKSNENRFLKKFTLGTKSMYFF